MQDIDALIVGAGFGGLYQLYKLRKAGFSARIFEAASNIGGVWHWNCYPGARVDSEGSIYQLSVEDLWKDWNWEERFPGREELVKYFDHMEKKLDLKRDISFDTRVVAAHFDTSVDRWVVSAKNGLTARARYLILCTGFASKPLYPDFKGLDSFKGVMHHTCRWPQEGIDLSGKRVGVIGTGASGVQVIQETGPIASHLTVFQRTPNLALPMRQRKFDEKEQAELKELLPVILRRRPQTFSGFHYDVIYTNMYDSSEEERTLLYEDMWAKGGFGLWIGIYLTAYVDEKANEELYAFWRKKVSARIHGAEMQRKLAPEKAPHPYGTKHPSLEQRYFEVYNQPNVTLVDLQENAIVEVTPKGVKTQDGVEHELDVLVLATGYDAITGSIADMDIKGTDGTLIGDKWGKHLSTYLGLASANYPNMFFPYGPHGPTALCNGPTCVELQCDWITECLSYMRDHNHTRIDADQGAEDAWVAQVNQIFSTALWSRAKSYYTGANVPGKRVEALSFTGGVVLYNKMTRECAEAGYKGFVLSSIDGADGK